MITRPTANAFLVPAEFSRKPSIGRIYDASVTQAIGRVLPVERTSDAPLSSDRVALLYRGAFVEAL